MAERRKREDPNGPEARRREKRQRRWAEEDEEDRQHSSATVTGVVGAVGVMAGAVAAEVARAHCPPVRKPLCEPKRLPWAHHEANLDKRHGWRRSYRMGKESFYKLVELPCPQLEVNPFFGLRSPANGAIPVEVRLAVASRILAGASYWDVALMFGLSHQIVYIPYFGK